ncbi:hypothetical protein Busp01_01210 [Trinickia caryophylli]|nr:hypothetical protein Busp01_01210 [Trinickia caryophylli]
MLIGAEGLTDAVLAEIKVHLDAHELIKVRVFGDERDERVAIYDQICDALDAAPIQHIGKLLVIWKPKKTERAVPAKTAGARRGTAAPSAREAAAATATATAKPAARRGAAPRLVKVVKPTDNPTRRPKPQTVVVRGNERVTAGGTVKRAKKRQTSAKRQHQAVK